MQRFPVFSVPSVSLWFILLFALVGRCAAQTTQPAVSPSNPPAVSPSNPPADPVLTLFAQAQAAYVAAQAKAAAQISADQAAITALQVKLAAAIAATQPAAPTTQPTPQPPADVVYTPDKTYHVSPAGSDQTGDGSIAHPYATEAAAAAAVAKDRAANNGAPALAEIAYLASGTYAQDFQQGFASVNNVLFDSYGATSAEQRAVITANYCPFLYLNAQHVHLQNLRIAGGATATTNPQQSMGVYSNGGDDVTLDYCEVDGFQMNVTLVGGVTHARLYHCWIANAYTPSTSTMSCSGLYTECVAPDVEANVFYHNGWVAPYDTTNAAMNVALMFRHGWYENPSNGATGGTDKYNLYLRNACTGHQCRAGAATSLDNVYWDNGNATDHLTNSGLNNALGCELGNSVFFGNLTKDFMSFGGGVLAESAADNLHDLLFLSDGRSEQLPPAISLADAPAGAPAGGSTATITHCRGVWLGGDLSYANGRTATLSNVSIRKPHAGETVPTLLDFYGTADDASTGELLRTHLHTPAYGAAAVIPWAIAHAPAN